MAHFNDNSGEDNNPAINPAAQIGPQFAVELEEAIAKQRARLPEVHQQFLTFIEGVEEEIVKMREKCEKRYRELGVLGRMNKTLEIAYAQEVSDLAILSGSLNVVSLVILLGDQQTLHGQLIETSMMLAGALVQLRKAEDKQGRLIVAPGSFGDN